MPNRTKAAFGPLNPLGAVSRSHAERQMEHALQYDYALVDARETAPIWT
jgi:hypothetical protein